MSSADALQIGRARVSSFEPGAKSTLIFWTSFGLPLGSPASVQVASASKPEDVLGVCAVYVPANDEPNRGLASAAVEATSPTAPAIRITLALGTRPTLLLFPAAA